MSRENAQIAKIKQMMIDLEYACYLAKVPMTCYCQYTVGNKMHEEKIVVSPASVDFVGNTQIFYDIQNVMNGNFTTVPKKRGENETDPFAISSDDDNNLIYE